MENDQKAKKAPLVQFLPESAEKILRGLARYKFMSAKQMAFAGVATDEGHARKRVADLLKKIPECLHAVEFPVYPGIGKVPKLYFLTEHGVEAVAELFGLEDEQIKRPKGRSVIEFRDYFHRTRTIDFFISFGKWADANGMDIHRLDGYYDKSGANHGGSGAKLTALNRIDLSDGFMIPDGVAHFGNGERDFLFMVEIYNEVRTKRVVEQLQKHVDAIAENAPSNKYGYDRGSRVAVIFETETAKNVTLTRLRSNDYFSEFKDYFLFKTLDELAGEFFGNWSRLDGKKGNFV